LRCAPYSVVAIDNLTAFCLPHYSHGIGFCLGDVVESLESLFSKPRMRVVDTLYDKCVSCGVYQLGATLGVTNFSTQPASSQLAKLKDRHKINVFVI